MHDKITIKPGTIQETLIVPLYARKKCGELFPELYADPVAADVCDRLDYDFAQLDRKYRSPLYQFGALEGAMRPIGMMAEINDYLAAHPHAAIVSLGCGLDADPRRCGTEHNRIYNVDFPDVIAAREQIIGVGARETNIGCDLTDPAWMDQIDAGQGAIFYAAGVFHYLSRAAVEQVVQRMTERFPECRLVFDTLGPLGYHLLMREVLKSHGMKAFREHFYTQNAPRELAGWSAQISVTTRGYMLGYHDMKAPGVRPVHRLLARVFDQILRLQIVRVDIHQP